MDVKPWPGAWHTWGGMLPPGATVAAHWWWPHIWWRQTGMAFPAEPASCSWLLPAAWHSGHMPPSGPFWMARRPIATRGMSDLVVTAAAKQMWPQWRWALDGGYQWAWQLDGQGWDPKTWKGTGRRMFPVLTIQGTYYLLITFWCSGLFVGFAAFEVRVLALFVPTRPVLYGLRMEV